jgi:hypothetical protein
LFFFSVQDLGIKVLKEEKIGISGKKRFFFFPSEFASRSAVYYACT